MAEEKSTAFCETCNAQRLIVRPGTNHILHLLLTLVTFGLWLIVWIFGTIKIGGWRCSVCGTKVPFAAAIAGDFGGSAPAAKHQDIAKEPTIGKSGLPDAF